MKKATLIIIGLIYVASIVIVSMFGLNAIVYKKNIPVLSIECVNETIGQVYVDDSKEKKVIRITFTEPGDLESLTGTILQLEFRVLPDDASDKSVRYVYAREKYPHVKFHQIDGVETGAIVFEKPAMFTLTIIANDNSGASTEVLISCR